MSIFSAFKSGNGETLGRHYRLADSGWWNVHMFNGSLKAEWGGRCQGRLPSVFRIDTTFNYELCFIIWAVIIICVLILKNSLWQQNEQPFPLTSHLCENLTTKTTLLFWNFLLLWESPKFFFSPSEQVNMSIWCYHCRWSYILCSFGERWQAWHLSVGLFIEIMR